MPLLSTEFLLLALSAVVLLNVLEGGLRTAAFLAINAVFIGTYLEPAAAASTGLFALAGFAAARLAERSPRTRLATIPALTAAFFVLRGYGFQEWLLPDALVTRIVATAGLSFLFFKLLHVVIEAGSRTLGPLRFVDFLGYVSNFTCFLLGPIQRYQDFRADWHREREVLPPTFEAHLGAVNRVLRGLVKKFVLAELIAGWALGPGLDVSSLALTELTWRSYVFYFYLYLDFSGYCDVVIGVGRLMGVRPPENFHLPFLSPNVSQYWLRVHRSLTTWITDFLFNPMYAQGLRRLGGRVPTLAIACAAVFVTMVAAGVWHGTTANFAVFGVVHGLYLVGFRVYEDRMRRRLGAAGLRRFRETLLSRLGGVLLTFNLASLAYVPFALETEQLRELSGRLLP